MGVCIPALTNEITITNAGIQAVRVCVYGFKASSVILKDSQYSKPLMKGFIVPDKEL